MVFTGLPMGINAAEYHGDEVVAEVPIENLGAVPAALEGYDYEQLQQVELVGAEPYGEAAVSHLYTLKDGESVTFSDEMSGTITYGTAFAGGSGTAADPYLISNYDQLKAIGDQSTEGLYYKLTADIQANESAPDENSPNV